MEEELDFREFFNIFWRKKWIMVLITIIFICIGTYYTYNYTVPKYKSSTTLLLVQNYSGQAQDETNEITQKDITLNQQLVSTYSTLVKSNTIIKKVLENLNMPESLEEEIKQNVDVQAVADTQVIKITYSNADANIAYKVTNELSNVFCEEVAKIYNLNNTYIVDKAEIASLPYNINHPKDIIVFALIGIIVSAILIFIANLLDTTIKTAQDIEINTGLIVLAQIPEIKIEGREK